ncbi:Receptor-type guanylate cyclase gcy [Seminavis robusta]|uniref:Receptor-type guanylate cyclase gcy n=1 Tax=Seminavis robusta TaxID=568900 RepID=A0A9N8EIV2_9STRA|nr:Receptor-type guanylate cyclase gcy [Seminavis robusta]|eukprot:Sro1246_g255790.1 Receptor-type guanylate cyclase gcy (1449) ;mRNA; r:15473-20989
MTLSFLFLTLTISLSCLSPFPLFADAALTVPCNSTSQCAVLFRPGSKCNHDGFCTNPFYHGGCLSNLGLTNKTRICNSQDSPDALAKGYCRSSPLGYPEVRLAARNWESANLGAWILQILLSELLDVPTSIEGGSFDVNMNFYDLDNGFDVGNAGVDPALQELQVAHQVQGDCASVTNSREDYQPCMHVNQETYASWYDLSEFKDFIEPVRELGAMTENAWFIPRFAALNDSSLVSYAGLSGEENRRKLAETFKTPTRWGHYCQEYSPTNCAPNSDALAHRPPANDEEADSFFVDGLFYGFFRYTDLHNCDKYPTNCTGHFVDVPCEWITYAPSQLYHNDIAMTTERYTYTEQTQIYRAANATKSPVMYQAYTIDLIYADFVGSDAEFTRVTLPVRTQDCIDARHAHVCGDDFATMIGEAAGSCDTAPEMLKKTLSRAFRTEAFSPDVPPEFWSPAVAAVEQYQITVPQLGQIYTLWFARQTDAWNYDPRDAVCQFVVDNMDMVQSWIPETHPRVVHEAEREEQGLSRAAIALASLALAAILVSMLLTFFKRKTASIYHTQIEFIYLVLGGMLLVTIGAVAFAVDPSDGTCASIYWLTDIGFALQLAPLLHRIKNINRLTSSGNGMQRVRLRLKALYGFAFSVVGVVAMFLTIWYILDQPREAFEYELKTDDVTPQGETIIHSYAYCGSEQQNWHLLSFAWMALILVPGCMLGFITSQVKEDMNDTNSLALTLYFHSAFLLAWFCSYLLLRESDMPKFMIHSSFLLSADTIGALGIYLLPKFLRSGDTIQEEILPDVFVHTTIALLDVQGFSAWSSVREPVQVFQFLERLYASWDVLAAHHGVYKVETVGECYVAATGIPDAQSDHVVRMAKFVSDCCRKMPKFVRKMEEQFGPDTRELQIRAGMNSGAVTGGFLKGKGARFQLFGDTMTTATLIQTNSASGRIHLSQTTAELLLKAGKRRWIMEREEKVHTIEKGEMKTYWLVKGGHGFEDVGSSNGYLSDDESEDGEEESEERWVEFNVGVFKGLLQQILIRRAAGAVNEPFVVPVSMVDKGEMPLSEVQEIIELPKFNKRAAKRQREAENIEIPNKVMDQLKLYVKEISIRYNRNAFHNFAHASYVVMAVTKYLNRIIAATDAGVGKDGERFRSSFQAALHDHTYGIASDALTQFAVVFTALIHDVDHPGVPNPQFIKENSITATKYKNRSVAEQNSFDIAWDLLMEERFTDLLSAICQDSQDLCRFRQLVVNALMATDLGDKEMKALRNGRWDKAFQRGDSSDGASVVTDSTMHDSETARESRDTTSNRKATIVIEHLIQAADVAHMSQHWHIYRKWNERLFRETYAAFREGRANSNPADNWYNGEIGFFNFYIIPLSEKLRDCGVFGPTSDENLNYAVNNRDMWEKNGQAITDEMHKRVEEEYNTVLVAPASKSFEITQEQAMPMPTGSVVEV